MRDWSDAPRAPPGAEGNEAVAAVIGYVALIAERHFAQAGRVIRFDKKPTAYWFLFGLGLQSALIPHTNVLKDPDYLAFLRGLFAEIFDCLMFAYAGNPARELAELYRAFGSGIECGPILPLLLPAEARPVMDEANRILGEQYEAERQRADQMGY